MALAFFTAECPRLNWREQAISAFSSPDTYWLQLRMWQIHLWPPPVEADNGAQVCHIWNNCLVTIHKAGSHRPCFWLKAAISAVPDAGLRAVLRALQWGQAVLRIWTMFRSWWSPVSARFPCFPDYNASLRAAVPGSRGTRGRNTETACELYTLPILSSSGKWDFWIISLHLGVSHYRLGDQRNVLDIAADTPVT